MLNKIMILAPHTDDGELGMGATIARFIEAGHDVYYVAFSCADKSLNDGYIAGTLRKEVRNATKVLGIPEDNLIEFDYTVREFSYRRQDILEDIIKLKNNYSPDVVFMPTRRDLHQDHLVVSKEGVRAFKKVNLFSYEMVWNNINFEADGFWEVKKKHLKKKVEALQEYKSQSQKDYMNPKFIHSMARVCGTQIGVPFAECFEVVRMIKHFPTNPCNQF